MISFVKYLGNESQVKRMRMARNWAIAIGINRYKNLPSLKYAVRDADLMRDWFVDEAHFEKVYLFTDNSLAIDDGKRPYESQPNRDNLLYFLRTRFEQPFLSAGDNLWFFFSGHGVRQRNRDYLMPSGVDPHPEAIENSAISLDYVKERLRRCGADNVVLILDACRDGIDEIGSRGATGEIEEEIHQGVVTIASCSPAEMSYEIKELEQGSFTYSLLQGLRIHGEGNCATLEKLYQYLRYRVPEINRIYRKPRQTPYAVVEPATKYHLILLPEHATLKDAETLKVDALNAEVNRNYDLAEQLWIRVLVVSPGDTDAIEGIRRLAQRTATEEPEVIRSRRDDSRGRSTTVDSIHRVPSRTSPPFNISRRRLIQIAGFTVTGIGVTMLVRTVPTLISDSKSNEKESISPSDKDIEKETPVSPQPESATTTEPKSELIKSEPFQVITVNAKGQEIEPETRQVEYFTEDLGNNVTLEMVSIPGGKFLMGSPKGEGYDGEKPQHEVTVKSFYMGRYPVTQAQWQAVMGNNPAEFQDSPQNPVENVSWHDAVEFCQRLSEKTGRKYRLPSEAEWEYACRAGTKTPFHFGETITGELANYNASYTYAEEAAGEYREKTTPVGSFPPNGFGLYDMHGNVWEWCADNWHNNYEGAPTDGRAWTTGGDKDRLPLRGGSWNLFPNNCRSAYRLDLIRRHDLIDNFVGFRVVSESGRTL